MNKKMQIQKQKKKFTGHLSWLLMLQGFKLPQDSALPTTLAVDDNGNDSGKHRFSGLPRTLYIL